MAKSKKKKKTNKAVKTDSLEKQAPIVQAPPKGPTWLNPKWHLAILFCTAFLLYANTLTHGYTQDDAIVIYDNMLSLIHI